MPTPFVELTVGGMSVQPISMLVKQADGAHELMTFVVDPRQLPYHGREEGLPVQLRWGHFPGNTQSFAGYVHHTEPYYDRQSNDAVKLICLGASTVLSAPLQQSWAGQTADTVVRSVAEAGYLSVDVEPHPKVWPVLAATTGTAWDFLIELAGRVGYRLSAHLTEVRFVSPTTLFNRFYSMSPVLNMGGELRRFRLLQGTPGALVGQRTVYGVDQRAGQLFSVTDAGASTVVRLGTELPVAAAQVSSALADSPGDGVVKLAGEASVERFTYSAQGEAWGDALYAPGILIFLAGLEATQRGHWYVQGVEHDIDFKNGDYTVYLALGRDAFGTYAPDPMPAVVQPLLRQTPLGDVVSSPPPAVYVNGQWRSGWARRAS